MNKHDVIVVGAGISGLLTALALTKEGRNVLVLEKAEEIGGVCRSYMVEGYQVDTGPHIITRINDGPLRELMTRYFDVVPNFVPHGKYFVRLGNRTRPFPWNLQGWFAFDVLPEIDRLYLIKTLFSVSYLYNAGEDPSKKSVGELIGNGVSPQTKRFLNCLSYFMTGAPINQTPVARFIDAQSYKTKSKNILEQLHNALMKEGALDQVYPKGGLQSLITAILTSIPKNRIEIRTSEEIKRIHPEKKTIETNKGEYGYNTLIYSGFASDLPDKISDLPEGYQKSLDKLPKVDALTIWMGLSEQVFRMQGSEIWADSDPFCWAVPISNYDLTLAPKDRQLVGFAFRMPTSQVGNKEKKSALEAIYRTMPQIEEKVDMIHYQTLIPEKALWTVNTEFADIRTPYEGLYLVGTDTYKKSMGLTRASYSVLKLLEALKTDKVI